MTVGDLKKELELISDDKIVVTTDPSGVYWDNVGEVLEGDDLVKITSDGNGLFQES